MRTALTIGTFALPHVGHAAFLRACEAFGTLTVGVNSDAFVMRYRGRPALFNEQERMELIAALGYTVIINDGPGRDLIERLRPDVVVVGSDWARRSYLAQIDVHQTQLDAWGITIAYLPMRPAGISSTEVMRRCQSTAMPASLTSPII